MAVFTPRRRLARTAEIDRNELHAVTNSKYRSPNLFVKIRRHTRSVLVRHARGPARKDHALRTLRGDLVRRKMKWMYLAINALLPHTPCDQLRVLRAKIEDDDKFMVHFV